MEINFICLYNEGKDFITKIQCTVKYHFVNKVNVNKERYNGDDGGNHGKVCRN